MRLVAYECGGETGVGIQLGDVVAPTPYRKVIDLILDGKEGFATIEEAADHGERIEPDRLLTPIHPGKMLFSGLNYRSHMRENPTASLPSEPMFFSKLPSAVIGPGEPILIPSPDTLTDWEVELGVVVGRTAKQVSEDEALEYVFGYTIVNDVTARDLQFRRDQMTLGKGIDTFSPVGPCIVTRDEIPDPQRLTIGSHVNGEEYQHSSTADMIFSIPRLLSHLTAYVTLQPGDLVSTGTPEGIGWFREPQIFLKPGDEVTVSADGIGKLTNPVAAGW